MWYVHSFMGNIEELACFVDGQDAWDEFTTLISIGRKAWLEWRKK